MSTKFEVPTVTGKLLESNPRFIRLSYLIKEQIQEFENLVKEIQAKCSHSTGFQNKYYDPAFFGDKRLFSKACIDCGIVFLKPSGSEYKICSYCWSPMIDDGPARRGEDRIYEYHCSKCGHQACHT